MMLLINYRLLRVLPCLADPDKVRAIFELGEDIREVLPYLNTTMRGSIYNYEFSALTLKKDGMIISLYPYKATIAKADDEAHALRIMEWLKDLINETYENRSEIEPNFGKRGELKALDVYKLLPRTNCRECGELTCLAFAVRLLGGERMVRECSPLFRPEHIEKQGVLINLLKDTGYGDGLEVQSVHG